MYRAGQKEIDAIAKVIQSGKLFRYVEGNACARFETRWAKYVGVRHAHQTASGTASLIAALTGLGLGPGDEVIIPAHTFMATAVAVLAVGAIPVIVDIDESITMSPAALENAIGPLTRAVIPVHMWGLPCDMDAIMEIARRRGLFVVEDACQGVGGAYKGRMLGSIGDAGAFSFNYFKNITCGEGGVVVTNDDKVSRRAFCSIDCCNFFWNEQSGDDAGFTAGGSRASVIEGAMLIAQLRELPGMIRAMRAQKKRALRATADFTAAGMVPAKANSLDYECAAHNVWQFPSAAQAEAFQKQTGAMILGRTGRHTYNEWTPILTGQGGPHPAMNPYNFPQNRRCRRKVTKDQFPRSLEILGRTVTLPNHPDRTAADEAKLIKKIRAAAQAVLGGKNK